MVYTRSTYRSSHMPIEGGLKVVDDYHRLLKRLGKNSIVMSFFQQVATLHELTPRNTLPWNDRFYGGGTGYINNIRIPDVHLPVMWGKDLGGRLFVVIRYACKDQPTDTEYGGQQTLTFFQRFTDDGTELFYNGSNLALSSDSSLISNTLALLMNKTDALGNALFDSKRHAHLPIKDLHCIRMRTG